MSRFYRMSYFNRAVLKCNNVLVFSNYQYKNTFVYFATIKITYFNGSKEVECPSLLFKYIF